MFMFRCLQSLAIENKKKHDLSLDQDQIIRPTTSVLFLAKFWIRDLDSFEVGKIKIKSKYC